MALRACLGVRASFRGAFGTRSASTDAAAFDRIVLARRSARDFDSSKAIPDELRDHLLRLTQRSPSGFNAQPWVMIAVQSTSQRERLAGAMVGGANARRVISAPLSVIFAADLQAVQSLPELQQLERRAGKGVRYLRSLETDLLAFSSLSGSAMEHAAKAAVLRAGSSLGAQLPTVNSAEAWAFKNAALAAQTLMLGATAHGLASCAMEGFNGDAVRRVCAIPPRYGIPLIVALGHPRPPQGEDGGAEAPSPRYSLREAARLDTFDAPLLRDTGSDDGSGTQ